MRRKTVTTWMLCCRRSRAPRPATTSPPSARPDSFAARRRGLPDNYAALYGLTLVAGAYARIGDHQRSTVLYDRLLPYRGLVAHVGPAGSGCVDHFLGSLATALGRLDQADGHFREAAAVNERLAVPTWLARTRLEWAQMLHQRNGPGDDEHAAQLLSQALATAVDLGLGGVERRARALLEECR